MPIWNVGKRSLLCIHGPDAMRYLNGQITQDAQLAIAHGNCAFATCVTDAKGRLQAYGSIFSPDGSTLYLEAPRSLREPLFSRIEKYLIADDAEIVDVSDDFLLLHEIGNEDENAARGAVPHVPLPAAMSLQHDRLGVAGIDHWLPITALVPTCDVSFEEAEGIRIVHGEPRWGTELGEGILPPEAGLESRAISYTKGCYIGQEVISRMKTAGKVNRKLVRLMIKEAESVTQNLAGLELLANDCAVGFITSHQGNRAIAWLKKTAFAESNFQTADGCALRRVD